MMRSNSEYRIIGREKKNRNEMYLSTTTARSPLMVPGSDFCGFVAPISFLPYLITPLLPKPSDIRNR
jgi:hypothetical protein